MIPHNRRAPTMDVVVYKGTKDVRKQLFRSKLKTKQFQVRFRPPIKSGCPHSFSTECFYNMGIEIGAMMLIRNDQRGLSMVLGQTACSAGIAPRDCGQSVRDSEVRCGHHARSRVGICLTLILEFRGAIALKVNPAFCNSVGSVSRKFASVIWRGVCAESCCKFVFGGPLCGAHIH